MLKHSRDIMNWLSNNGFQVCIAQDEDYSYNLFEKTIYIGNDNEIIKTTESWFKDFLKTYGCARVAEFNIHTLAFLHELGHYITIPSFSNKELSWFATIKEIITEQYDTNEIDRKTGYLKYWSIQDELAANKWTVNFINDHYDVAKQLDAIMTLAN